LRDLAGVTVAGLRRRKLFASERFIIDCFVPSWKDPIAMPTIVVGLEDEVDFIRYLDLSLIRMPKNVPRYIHCDIAFTNDALGLSMSGVAEWTDSSLEEEDGTFSSRRVPIIETDFIMRIKARDGDRIPIHKMRKFIFDLKAEGFRIKKFTSDLRLASEDTLQIFQKAGIEAEYLSVDKTDDAYVNFQHLVYEKRWRCHRHEMLLFELKNLERDADKGKIDHPEEVTDIEFLGDGSVKEVVLQGSKDVSDSVVGSVQSCVLDMGTPIDTKQIVSIAKKLREGSASDNPGGILLTTNDGKTIEGTVSGGKVANNMRDLFKKLK